MQYTYFLLIKMLISFHNAHFLALHHVTEHTVSLKNLRIKLALSFIFFCRFFYYFLGRFFCERGGGRLKSAGVLYLKICKIILNYLENVRFWICSILENKIGEITREIPWMLIEPNLIMLISWIRFTCCYNATDKTGDMCTLYSICNILQHLKIKYASAHDRPPLTTTQKLCDLTVLFFFQWFIYRSIPPMQRRSFKFSFQ
jgi:hypothetical protein